MSTLLRRRVEADGLFQGYAYSYPHKTAYRRFDPPLPLDEVWHNEDRSALYLYAHVPFCGMRCGFCNLFTTTGGTTDAEARYLDALERQADAVAVFVGDGNYVRTAIGGGTPTMLSVAGIERLFGILSRFRRPSGSPVSVEMSPETVTSEKMRLLRECGTTRASLGVQSFVEAETRALGRPQRCEDVRHALLAMREAGFSVMNVDLIYGTPGQTTESWRVSLEALEEFSPEEVFLYPLYIRPLTGLGRKDRAASAAQSDLYRQGRDHLLSRGYRQISMRLFRAGHCKELNEALYCCQEDGMLGLGAGARSYTRRVHYSSEWAVGRDTVRGILDDFIQRDAVAFSHADYGCVLAEEEQRRRYVIKSMLRSGGLDSDDYQAWFGSRVMDDFPQLQELLTEGTAVWEGSQLRPTALGLEWSDVIGPWLYSDGTSEKMEHFSLR